MPVNPADSPILGTLYGSDAMRAVFDETSYFQRMLDVEAALARVQGRMGIIPAEAADTIVAAAKLENLNSEELAASARNVTSSSSIFAVTARPSSVSTTVFARRSSGSSSRRIRPAAHS